MANDLVLITGGNGHIGLRALVYALEAGYRVRAAVRSQAKADLISLAPSVQKLKSADNLTFTIVPDLLKQGAYDEAVKNVKYIIHIASPITNNISEDKYETHLIQPALRGTLGILEAAQQSPTVKRVVITSSIVAIMSWNDFFVEETGKVFKEQSRTPDPTGPYGNEFEAYSASKVIALNATAKFLDEQKPSFDVVHVHPAFVIGKDELVSEVDDMTRGTNGAMLGQVLGVKTPYPTPGNTIHVADTALAHVKALEPQVPSGQSLFTSSGGLEGTTWGDAIEIVKKHFPKAVESGVLPNNGSTPTKKTIIDSSATEKLLGMKFKSYEEQVVSVVEHYLELRGVEAA